MIEITSNAAELSEQFARMARQMPGVLKLYGQEMTKEALDRFQQGVETWNHQPEFRVEVTVDHSGMFMAGGTDDPIWQMVNKGTSPHSIVPRHAKMLAFQTGYRAKTRPGVMRSYAGGSSGPYAYAKAVQHPGTAPRDFYASITKSMARIAESRLYKALKNWIKQNGF